MKAMYMAFAAAALFSAAAQAQEQEQPKLKLTPTGRILMDGALYFDGNKDLQPDESKFVDGVAIPDVRLGLKATYGQWKAKVDIGFSNGKVGMKDIYFEYDLNQSNLFRLGYFVPQFGLNSTTSSSMKPSYEEEQSNDFFYSNPRLIGLMHIFDKGQFFAGTTLFIEGNAISEPANELGKQAWGAQTRLVWRPQHRDGEVFQIGCSFNYSSPTAFDHTGFEYKVNFPSRVSKIQSLDAKITDARGLFKMSPELLFARGRLALETQYYYMNVARKNGLRNYRAQGAYGLFRALLIGSQYQYSHGDCGLATPAPRSLELCLGYNYTNATDGAAGIYGGKLHDVNCTLNYYINKYMIARLRYSYTRASDRYFPGVNDDGTVCNTVSGTRHVNLLEARLQVIF